MATATTTHAPDAGAAVVSQLTEDERHTAAELTEILAHCRSVTASADFRMLQAASLIHEQREEDFLCEVAAVDSGEVTTTAELADRLTAARLGTGPAAEFGPNGLERAVAEVGAVLNIAPRRARDLIVAGSALRHRLPFTGHALATGRLDLSGFLTAVARTRLVTPDAISELDAHLSQAIFARPPMSSTRFTVMVDAAVARIDPDALLRRRERAAADRKVVIGPDRHTPGQSRVAATLPMESAADFDARLTAMAGQPHATDPRTRDQRRADAMLALARGQLHLACLCADCAAADNHRAESTPMDTSYETDSCTTPVTTEDDSPVCPEGDLAATDEKARCACAGPVRPTFHIVVNLSTLIGFDNDPGMLDGHGLVDADTMRSLLAQSRREFLRPHAPVTTGYTPSRRLQALVRAGELCCTFPGCSTPAWNTDLDHTVPYGKRGATARRNLKPLCRLHHRIKTFTGWRDHQDPLGTVFFESPTGHMFLGNAYTGTDLFAALRSPPDRASDAARAHLDRLRHRDRDAHHRMIRRHQDANPPPF